MGDPKRKSPDVLGTPEVLHPAAARARLKPGRKAAFGDGEFPGQHASESQIIHFRCDPTLLAAIENYRIVHGMKTRSEAMRTLMWMGADEHQAYPDKAFRIAAYREGLQRSMAVVREKIEIAIAEALQTVQPDEEG